MDAQHGPSLYTPTGDRPTKVADRVSVFSNSINHSDGNNSSNSCNKSSSTNKRYTTSRSPKPSRHVTDLDGGSNVAALLPLKPTVFLPGFPSSSTKALCRTNTTTLTADELDGARKANRAARSRPDLLPTTQQHNARSISATGGGGSISPSSEAKTVTFSQDKPQLLTRKVQPDKSRSLGGAAGSSSSSLSTSAVTDTGSNGSGKSEDGSQCLSGGSSNASSSASCTSPSNAVPPLALFSQFKRVKGRDSLIVQQSEGEEEDEEEGEEEDEEEEEKEEEEDGEEEEEEEEKEQDDEERAETVAEISKEAGKSRHPLGRELHRRNSSGCAAALSVETGGGREGEGGQHLAPLLTPCILEEAEEEVSIIQRIYQRAAKDLHSRDARKVEHARLMLHRLKQAGFEPRPKMLSHPQPAGSPVYGSSSSNNSSATSSTAAGACSPTIKVTPADLASPKAASTPARARPLSKVNLDPDAPTEEPDGPGSAPPYTPTFETSMEFSSANLKRRRSTGRLCSSCSDSNLYKKSALPISVLLGAMETTPMARRKDSVVSFRKRSSVPTIRKHSLVVTLSSAVRDNRRHSCRDTLGLASRYGQVLSTPLPYDAQGQKDEPDAMAWSVLMSSLPAEERRSAQIRRQHLVISVPVCVVGKENPVTFTSMEAIERTLRRLHPEVLVKKRAPHEDEGKSLPLKETIKSKSIREVSPTSSPESKSKRDRKLAVVAPPMKRHISINTCITVMRTATSDYDQQLEGVKTIGAFAEEETLKVLFAKSEAIACIISAMKMFPEKEELQINACVSLVKMASASESNCVHILRNNGVTVISSTLRRHLDNPDIVRKLLNVVAYISTAVDLAASLVEGGLHSEILSVMSRHAADKEIVRESCFVIGNLLVTEETANQLMLVGGVHTIISLVRKFPGDEDILENVCRTLGSFAIYDDTCLDVAKAGATSAVLDAMRPGRTNVAVYECGLWALASLTASAPTCLEVESLDGVPVIISVLKNCPHEENLQDYGMRTLCNLSSSDLTSSAVGCDVVLGLLQHVLKNFPESVELLEITMVTLSQIMLGDEHQYATLASSHCVQDIVSTMNNFPENTLIQESGCKVMGNLAVQDNLRKLVEADGASRAVIAAMLTLDTCADIQEVGCVALMNLTADNEDNKVRIKNAGAVTALVNTLQEFQYCCDVVLCALKALGNLVSLEEVCHLLLDDNGLDTVISLIGTHENNDEILVFVSLILCGITELPDLTEKQASLIDCQLMSILSTISYNADVNLYVCQAIENLIKADIGRDLFFKENRMEVVLSAMDSFSDNSQIHRCCCKIIAVVSLCADKMKRMITETSLSNVLKSMELFPLDVELQIIGCATLACLLEKAAILKDKLIGQGGISLIRRALTMHNSDSRLAVVAIMALDHLMPIDQYSHPVDASLAKDGILKCMRSFSENKEIQISGCRALSKIDISNEEDIIDVAKSVIEAIRRHGQEPEVQRLAADALKPYYKLGVVSSSPQSPTQVSWTRP